jgi:hypothetical protein
MLKMADRIENPQRFGQRFNGVFRWNSAGSGFFYRGQSQTRVVNFFKPSLEISSYQSLEL